MPLLSVLAKLPTEDIDYPPVILVHGAANAASVWTFWQQELSAHGWPTYALDLRGHGGSEHIDLSQTSMDDYAADVVSLARQLRQQPVVVGWSMGGLVAMMCAASGLATACVALAPSMPARHVDSSVELRPGEFGPEEYGIVHLDPNRQPEMPALDLEERTVALASLHRESRFARDERRRGIVIEALPGPLLIITGTMDSQWPRERYDGLWLEADYLTVEGASHWGLVLNRRAITQAAPAVRNWLESTMTGSQQRI